MGGNEDRKQAEKGNHGGREDGLCFVLLFLF